MKILVISPVLPWPVTNGVRVRIYNTIKELSSQHVVDFICPIYRNHNIIVEAEIQLKQFCRNIYFVKQPNIHLAWRVILKIWSLALFAFVGIETHEFYTNLWPFVRKIRELLANNSYDLVMTNSWYTAIQHIRDFNLPTICDSLYIHSEILYLAHIQKTGYFNWFWKRYINRIYEKEAEALNNHDLVICVSERDAKYLQTKLKVTTPIAVYAHVRGKEPLEFRYSPDLEDVILFFGSLNNLMNMDAVKVAAEQIFPLIKRDRKEARLVIAGSGGNQAVINLANKGGIEYLGFVKDIKALFHNVKVLLIPIRIGSGIKGRVIEAMEAGTPVVGSNIAAEGYPVINGKHMFISDTPEIMANQVIELLSNESLRHTMAISARKFVEENYRWENTYGKIHDCLERAITNQKEKSRVKMNRKNTDGRVQ